MNSNVADQHVDHHPFDTKGNHSQSVHIHNDLFNERYESAGHVHIDHSYSNEELDNHINLTAASHMAIKRSNQRPYSLSKIQSEVVILFNADSIESHKEHILHNSLPEHYVANDGHFPVKDAYLDSLKFQFFGLGLSFGTTIQMLIVSLTIMFISTSIKSGHIRELAHEYYTVFRGVFLVTLFFLLFGLCIFVWKRVKVEYASILHASYALTYQFVLRGSNSIAYIVFTFFFLYTLTITDCFEGTAITRDTLKHLWPALTLFIPILLYVCPYDILTVPVFGVRLNGFTQRYTLMKEVAAVLITPFSELKFHRIIIADVLCSLPKVFPDLQYSICLYATGSYLEHLPSSLELENEPHAYYTCGNGNSKYRFFQIMLSILPFNIRLLQCIKSYFETNNQMQLWNALKYFLSIAVTSLAMLRAQFTHSNDKSLNTTDNMHICEVFTTLWICVGKVATVYSYLWDVFNDWGLGDFKLNGTKYLLRDDIHFEPSLYYAAMILNFLMRLGWAFVISPEQPYLKQHFILILATIEIFRRIIWLILRVEWEHTKNQNAIKMKAMAKNQLDSSDRLVSSGIMSKHQRVITFLGDKEELHSLLSGANNSGQYSSFEKQ